VSRRTHLLAPGALACLLCCYSTTVSAQTADLVFQHGTVFTGTPGVTAVAVRGDRIVYSGDDAGCRALVGPDTRVIDIRGGLLLPGLVDAHAHLASVGALLGEVSLLGTDSAAAAAARVRAAQANMAPGVWVHGRGWDQNDWEMREFPSWRDLSETEANPVYLERIDGHALWLNRTALDACSITRDTADPPGGRIVRDPDGNPTGVLIDNAEMLVMAYVPEVGPDQLDANLRRAVQACNRVGLVGVHDAGTSPAVLAALRRLAAAGELTLNVYAMLDSEYPGLVRDAFRRGPWEEFEGRLVVRSVKLRADGALGSRGALLLAPYDDDPGNAGLEVTPPESLQVWAAEAMRSGFQPATHAIGDRGNRIILDAYQQALALVAPRNLRPRVEHCQILSPEDIPRFARLGVIASMQPTHATSDMPWAAARVGETRLAGAYAWHTLLASGAHVAFGSDAPVESIDPLWGMYAAVTRQDHAGQPPGGWRPAERVSVSDAIRGFTSGAAYAAHDEMRTGSIATGLRADLTLIDTNLLTCLPGEILEARVVMTVVQGKIVYQAED
jgi:predicted amidohydrolase YtcJ